MMRAIACIFILQLLVVTEAANGQSVRIKDLVEVSGFRPNQLIGYGLVVGLPGTGDSAKAASTNKAFKSLMRNLGVGIEDDAMASQSVAGVIITADLAPHSKVGDRIDIKVATIGDAKDISQGQLVATPLKAMDGEVYALAQGAVVIAANATTKTSGHITSGATVEREFLPELTDGGMLRLNLKRADFTNNVRIVDRINSYFRGFYAESVDPISVQVAIPELFDGRVVEFLSELESLRIDVDSKATVIVNQQSGTIVIGSEVRVSPVAIAHGDLTIKVGDSGESGPGHISGINGTSVGELVKGLNGLGVKPADLVMILQAISAAGALQGELQIK